MPGKVRRDERRSWANVEETIITGSCQIVRDDGFTRTEMVATKNDNEEKRGTEVCGAGNRG